MRRSIIFTACVLFALAGCDGEKGPATSNSIAITAVQPEVSSPDYRVPLSAYRGLNEEGSGVVLSYLLYAGSQIETEAERHDLLMKLSRRYAQEQDSFVRKQLGQAEWPVIAEKLKAYSETAYVTLPVGGDMRQALALNPPAVGGYDSEHQGFPLLGYGETCWSTVLKNGAGANLRIAPSDLPCIVPVTDSELARRIEAVRSTGTLQLRGAIYLFIRGKDQSTVTALPVHYSLEFFDVRDGTSIGTVTL